MTITQIAHLIYQAINPARLWDRATIETQDRYMRLASKLRAQLALPTNPTNPTQQALVARAWHEGYITGINDATHNDNYTKTLNPYQETTND